MFTVYGHVLFSFSLHSKKGFPFKLIYIFTYELRSLNFLIMRTVIQGALDSLQKIEIRVVAVDYSTVKFVRKCEIFQYEKFSSGF